jgi:hypothetical protein
MINHLGHSDPLLSVNNTPVGVLSQRRNFRQRWDGGGNRRFCERTFQPGGIAVDRKEKGTAAKQVNRIRKSIRELGSMPARFVSVDWEPWTSMGMRKMPVNNYVVFYLIDDPSPVDSVHT